MHFYEEIISSITPLNEEYMQKAQERQNNLIKPVGSLGKLEDITIQLAGIYQSEFFDTSKKAVIAFASDHGVYEEGIAPNAQEITKIQLPNFVRGITGVGALAKFAKADVIGIDVGVNCREKMPGVIDRKIRCSSSNMAKGPAMSRDEAVRAIEIGIEETLKLIDAGYRVIGIGEMGIGNTTPSSAIISVMGDFEPIEVTGSGAGLNSEGVIHKAEVIKRAIRLNRPDKEDAVDVLAKVGGFEIGAMAGAVLACAAKRIPVVLDGFISYAAAILAIRLCPLSKLYMIPSHFSAEPASSKAFSLLDLSPMLQMDMRLGEGSGAALCFNVIEAANFAYNNMYTFAEAGFSV
ncbi:MAG: nicotinate-nucleotide--dimethylbenzimidazole phosphoribosyltransferase [Peptostreptococcaceae bacterium]|nr:nicotinate-nucleotide--dimethylbenzimidazole phosphoribosyltransferase [Peptostreptococcaceae bacterium]